jgi:multidrug efflux pump subunit AcrB
MYAFPMDEDIRIRVNGGDLDNLKNLESEVYYILTRTEGIINEAKGNTDYTEIYSMNINDETAAMKMTVPVQIINEMSLAISGRQITDIFYEGRKIPVYLTGGMVSMEDLGGYMLKAGDGSYMRADSVVEFTKTNDLSTIPRYDGEYSIMVTADYENGTNKSEILDSIKDKIDRLDLGGASVTYDGEDELIKENFSQVGVMAIFALAIVFMILLIQFRSFSLPLLIFMTIPLSAIGSIAGLYIAGQPVSFTALLGIVSLLGIVVNNAIILLDYIKKDMNKGSRAEKACMNAAKRRTRPIILSTATTVIGLIPLAIGNSQLFKPMAIALMSGLLVSTLLTLVVIPVSASVLLKGKNVG